MEAPIYNQEGKKVGKIALPERVFGVRWNADLVHQVVTAMQSNARAGTAHTKFRGEVGGGGTKPGQHMGTGRARHGSTRSPLWRHGGITHGPRTEKNYTKAVPRKMAARALASVLSRKLSEGEIIFVDTIAFDVPKTARATAVLSTLAAAGFPKLEAKKKNAALIALAQGNRIAEKSFRNIPQVNVGEWRNLSVVEALRSLYLVFEKPEEAVSFLSKKFE
jgi:large subunit ribosomal protein L4